MCPIWTTFAITTGLFLFKRDESCAALESTCHRLHNAINIDTTTTTTRKNRKKKTNQAES